MRAPHHWQHVAHQVGRFRPSDPYERVGLLLGGRTQLAMVEVTNHHADPATGTLVSRRDIARVTAANAPRRSVVGLIHTHPGWDPQTWEPSSRDLLTAVEYAGMVHAVYHPYTRLITVYGAWGMILRFHARKSPQAGTTGVGRLRPWSLSSRWK